MNHGLAEMGTFGGNVGPINTPVTGMGKIAAVSYTHLRAHET